MRSLWKSNKSHGKLVILKQKFHHGQCVVNLYKHGIQKTHRVHRLVADAFLPNQDNLPHVAHIDGNPFNNSVENIVRCDDAKLYEVIEKRYPVGYNKGENGTTATITNEKAIEVYTKAHSGINPTQVAEQCNVPLHIVNNIKHGHTWASVTGHKTGRL